jgi:predicted GIY-YIG superfamily endonuclease
MRTSDDWVYCGETDAIYERIQAHRAGRGGADAQFIVVEVPPGKSTV